MVGMCVWMDGWVVMTVYVYAYVVRVICVLQINQQIAGTRLTVGDTSVTLHSVELSQDTQIE